MSSSRKIDLVAVVIVPLLVFVSVFFLNLHITYLESLLLVFALPSIYLSLKNRIKVQKTLWFSLSVSIPVAIILELVGFGDHAWAVPHSILPWKLFGVIPLEDFLWMFLTVYLIVIFYEHFRDNKFQPGLSNRVRTMNYILYPLAALVILIFMTNANLLTLPYTYLWLGVALFLIPSVLFMGVYRSFLVSFLKVQIYFFFAHTLFELIGVKLGHWTFPGAYYVGWVSIQGLRFPLEELVFVMMLGAFAALSYYEFFANRPDPQASKWRPCIMAVFPLYSCER